MKKLFLTDIDGTLIKTGCPVHPEALAAIERFTASGGLFGLCTGRHTVAVRAIAAQLPINAPCILCGGAMLYDFAKDEPIRILPFDDGVFDTVRRIMQELPDVSVTVCTPQAIHNIRTNDMLLRRGVLEDRSAPMARLEDIRKPLKFLFTHDDPAVLEMLGREYIDPARYVYHAAATHFYEMTPLGVTKGNAAEEVRALYGGSENCLLFTAGDAGSDTAMAPVSDLFFVPQSAPERVRAFADRLIPSPVDGGIAEAICQIEAF